MGAKQSTPVPEDATQSQKFRIEQADAEANEAAALRRSSAVQKVGGLGKMLVFSGGQQQELRGPMAGVTKEESLARLPLDKLEPAPSAKGTKGKSKTPAKVPESAPAAAPPKPQHAAAAIGFGGGVMKDPPRNVFGPGMVVSPDMYPEFHRTGPYDRFLLTFSKLNPEERTSCFETLVHFQGKMGLLLRCCDRFCEATELYDLYKHMRDVCKEVLDMPHARLWQIDRKRNTVLCVFNNSDEDAQNGRTLPFLGCFPGELARGKKVLICNDCTNDSRFQSWQYKEMQATMNEPLSTIVGVALLDDQGQAAYAFEAYRPTQALLDGADAFLLQTLSDYAGAAAVAIRRRWEQIRVAQLPGLLLSSDSLAGFLSKLREVLKLWFNVSDVEIFMYEEEEGKGKQLWVQEDRKMASQVDMKLRRRSIYDRVVTMNVPKKQFAFGGKGLALEVGKQSSEGKGSGKTHITDNAPRDAKYNESVDSKCRQLLTTGLCNSEGKLIAVLQLRDRLWNPSWRDKPPEPRFFDKCSGFTSSDAEWLETLRPHLTHALQSALRKEATRLNKLQARMADRRALAIMTITNAIAKSIPTDDLFSIVVQEVVSLLNCDRATMWLLTEDRKRLFSMLQPMPIRKDSTPIRAEVPISNNSLSGSCTLNEEVINLKDAYDDSRFDKRFDKQTGYRTRSILVVPIVSETTEDVLGCLQCLNKQNIDGEEEGISFGPEDIELVNAFASIAAVAILQSKLEGAADYGVGIAIKQGAKRD